MTNIKFETSEQKLKKQDIFFINKLLRQLDKKNKNITEKRIESIVKQRPLNEIVVARDKNGDICGMASLYIFHTLSAFKGVIEDVVVDEKHRGKGIGERLIHKLIDVAKENGVQYIDLTSRPERKTASFYNGLGFKKRKTNVFRKESK